MGNFTQTRRFVKGDQVTSTKLNDIMSSATVANLRNENFAAGAAIAETKLDTISTADKVNVSALTIASQAAGDFLYHNGTIWTRLGVGTAGQKLRLVHDQANAYNKLMLHCDGSDAGVTFTDSNAGAKTVTNTANYDSYTKTCSHFDGSDAATAYTDPVAGAYTFVNSAQLDTADKKFGSASLMLTRATSDNVTLPDSANWSFGTGNFTIDWWMKTNAFDLGGGVVSQYADADNYWTIYENPDGKIWIYFRSGGVDKGEYKTTSAVNVNGSWNHWAVVRNGTTCLLFKNGVPQTLTETTAFGTNDVGDVAAVLKVGIYASDGHDGWIDEFRISKGIARWTADFSANLPAYPYGQVITSTTQKKFGTASGYFDGGGSYLNTADHADWSLSNGAFTIDFWVRFPVLPVTNAQHYVISQITDSSNEFHISVGDSAGQKYWRMFMAETGEADLNFSCNTTLVADTWYHIAVVRNGNAFNIYQDGVSLGSTTSTRTFPNYTEPLEIGRLNVASTLYFMGFLDEVRWSKGVARWTADFTPPTSAYIALPTWVTP